MNILTGFLSGLTSVFTTYVPALGKAIYDMFINLFTTTTESSGVITVTGFNELGYFAIALIGVGIVSGLVGLVMHVLRLRGRFSKNRKAV